MKSNAQRSSKDSEIFGREGVWEISAKKDMWEFWGRENLLSAKLPFPPSRLGAWSIHSCNIVTGPVLGSEEAAVNAGLI